MIKLTPAEPNERAGLKQSLKQWQSDVVLEPYSLLLKGYDDDELSAIVVLKFHPDKTAEIEKIVWKDSTKALNDKEFNFVIGNGILNFIDRRGIHLVYSSDTENKEILEMLKFEYDVKSDKFVLDLIDYFEPNCY